MLDNFLKSEEPKLEVTGFPTSQDFMKIHAYCILHGALNICAPPSMALKKAVDITELVDFN